MHVLGAELVIEECHAAVILEGFPIATDDAAVGDDGFEDAAVVVGVVHVLWMEHDVAAFIADKVFVIGRNQEEIVPPESSCAAIISQVEFPAFPFFYM